MSPAAKPGPLHRRLVLGGFLLRELGFDTFQAVADHLRGDELEGLGADGVTRFCAEIRLRRAADAAIDDVTLLGYDDAIVRHTAELSAHRGEDLRWKYFQYLALLTSERFLDRWFTSKPKFTQDLNEHLEAWNETVDTKDRLVLYGEDDLRKFALWCATGSGKTLVMHVNLLQFRDHLARHGRAGDLNRVILITPNSGLSRQHLSEFGHSGIAAALFTRDAPSLFSERSLAIVDIQKLRESEGDKTFAVDAFGRNNLVLVDEGHRGASGATWMDFRDRLSEEGFSFEYSATFGQAFGRDPKLSGRYAKWIGFDYAYRRFHADGFGKDYRILNLPGDEATTRHHYLCGALLSFYQQRRYFDDQCVALAPYRLESPLWIFVGSNVLGRVVSRGGSDVIDILLAFARFLGDPGGTAHIFERLLAGDALLVDGNGQNLFKGHFPYIAELGLDGEDVYRDVLQCVFNTQHAGKLRVVLLKGAEGEIALQVGENSPFGVVNVGDAAALHKLCREHDEILICDEAQATNSLFDRIDGETGVSVLIGAKKFIEGWNSWRVSSLGLMNVGRSEGAQIIQLFGRGVRLRGLEGGLKRSAAVEPPPASPPNHVRLLETLTVFGIRADYMARFREHLKEEGAPVDDPVEVIMPVKQADPWPAGLKIIRVPPGVRFERQERCRLRRPEAGKPKAIALDWYPRVQAMASEGLVDSADASVASKNAAPLTSKHVALLDLDRIHAALVQFKRQRGYVNLEITKDAIEDLLLHPADWYRLEIPGDRIRFTSVDQVREWEEIAVALLKSWCVRIYRHDHSAWETPQLRYLDLRPDDTNIIEAHVVTVSPESEFRDQLEEMREQLEACEAPRLVERLQVIELDEHVYQPLMALNTPSELRVSPVALNDGERRFVKDLREWASVDSDGVLENRQLHLLRNLSRGRGVGFFVAGNFYPDFLLWLVGPGTSQHVMFVDPKGIVRLNGINDPKIQFRHAVKDLERELGDPDVRLSSFILSNTPYREVKWHEGTKQELEALHVLFQSDDWTTYIGDMFRRALADVLEPAA